MSSLVITYHYWDQSINLNAKNRSQKACKLIKISNKYYVKGIETRLERVVSLAPGAQTPNAAPRQDFSTGTGD